MSLTQTIALFPRILSYPSVNLSHRSEAEIATITVLIKLFVLGFFLSSLTYTVVTYLIHNSHILNPFHLSSHLWKVVLKNLQENIQINGFSYYYYYNYNRPLMYCLWYLLGQEVVIPPLFFSELIDLWPISSDPPSKLWSAPRTDQGLVMHFWPQLHHKCQQYKTNDYEWPKSEHA